MKIALIAHDKKKNEMIERAELEQQESEVPVQKVVAQEKLNYLEEKERKKLERQRTRKIVTSIIFLRTFKVAQAKL